MNSIISRKNPRHAFALLSAAALLNAGSLFAAGTVDDAQSQAQALLSGRSHSPAQNAYSSSSAAAWLASDPEPQQQARWLLTGHRIVSDAIPTGAFPSGGNAISPVNTHADAQVSARRMILGRGE